MKTRIRNGVLTALALMASANVANSAENAQWHSTYKQALEETKKSSMPLFILLEEPEQKVELGDVSSSKTEELADYVLCRIDVTTEAGQKTAKAFKVKSLPHMAIIDKTGTKILHTDSGSLNQTAIAVSLVKYRSGELTIRKKTTSTIRSNYNWTSPRTQAFCPT